MEAAEEGATVMSVSTASCPSTSPAEQATITLEAYKKWLMTRLENIGCCCDLLMDKAPLRLKSEWIDNRLHSEACPIAVREMVRWSRWKVEP